MQTKQKRLIRSVVIILTYNCAHLVTEVYNRIPKNSVYRVIIIDDGSIDDIFGVAKKLNISLFSHPHIGYGGNMQFGLKKAYAMGADYVVEIHGDGQYDPRVIPKALLYAKRNAHDLLLGTRFVPLTQPLYDGMPWMRYIANIGLSFVERIILQVKLSEFHSGFRIYSRKLIETINLKTSATGHLFSFEIIAQAKIFGLHIAEIPVRCDYKKDHTSISIRNAILFTFENFIVLFDYIGARWLRIRSDRFTPLRSSDKG